MTNFSFYSNENFALDMVKQKQKLPSSRTLAESLEISRITVAQSYEQLTSEGYLETQPGSGTYVCSQLPDHWLPNQAKERSPQNDSQLLSSLSDYGRRLYRKLPKFDFSNRSHNLL